MARGTSAQDASVLEMALVGYEIEREKIDQKIAEIRSRLGQRSNSTTASNSTPKATGRKRVLSADARRRIAMAQKKRWAEHRRNKAKKAAA